MYNLHPISMYRSFTDSEKKIPQLFAVLYILIIIIALVSIKYII